MELLSAVKSIDMQLPRALPGRATHMIPAMTFLLLFMDVLVVHDATSFSPSTGDLEHCLSILLLQVEYSGCCILLIDDYLQLFVQGGNSVCIL